MIKPLLGAAFAIALTSAGAYASLAYSDGSNPAFVPSVKVAPLQSGQDSQAKLAPVDQSLLDSFANPTNVGQISPLESKSAYSSPQINNDAVDDIASSVLAAITIPTTIAVPNAKALGSNGPSSPSPATGASVIPDPTALILNAYDQALLNVTALNLPPNIKTQVLQLMQSMRTQILAALTSPQPSPTALIASVNAILAQVANLNLNATDMSTAYSALLSSLGALPGVNTASFATPPPPTTVQPSTALTLGAPGAQMAQAQSTIAQIQATLDAQRKSFAARQNEINSSITGQISTMIAADFGNAVLNSIYSQPGVNLAH